MSSIPVRNISPTKAGQSEDPFNIRSIASLLNGKDLLHPLHRHNYYYMLFVRTGKGTHQIDFTDYPVTDYTCFLLRPGQVHQLELKSNCTGFIFQFSDEFIGELTTQQLQLLRSVFRKPFYPLNKTQAATLSPIFELMLAEFAEKNQLYADVIRMHLLSVTIQLFRYASDHTEHNPQKSINQERLEKFQHLLEKNIVRYKKTSDYANMMNLSQFQLNSITKTLLGLSCSDVINDYIVLEARRYLLATNNQISQIALELGFDDPAYFIRFFRKKTGMTPEAMRKTLQ